jgi:acyl dehydratase
VAEESGYGRLTEQAIAQVRARIGKRYSIDQPHLRYVNADSIRHVAHGVGDTNPLWLDAGYASGTRYGALVSPPALLYGVAWGSRDMRRGEGLPGVHGLHAGDEWTYLRPLLAGDEVYGTKEMTRLDEMDGRFGGRSLMQVRRFSFFNQDDQLVAYCDMSALRTERPASKSRGKYADVEPAHYGEDDIARHDASYDQEQITGANPRAWEKVEVGDSVGTVAKGPLRVADMIAWLIGVGSPHVRSGQDWLAYRRQSPAVAELDPRSGVPDTVERVHWDYFMASEIGVPAPYDYGSQRGAFASHLFTNWSGDDGFLARLSVQYRGMVFLGDTMTFTGRVIKKWLGERTGTAFALTTFEAVTQRGELAALGRAVVALPTEDGRVPSIPLDEAEIFAGWEDG